MTNFEKYIKKSAEGYSLSNDERARMRRVIRQYMTYKPLSAQAGIARQAPISITYSWFAILQRPVAVALVVVFVFGSGISYAAEGALPGDVLYAVKTYINEPTRVAIATNAEARAEVQIDLAERRIEEAAILAADGRLDDSTEAELAASFKSYAGAARENIEEVETDDSRGPELASRFESRLAVHESVLAEVEFETADDSEREHRLSAAIRATTEILADARTKRDGVVIAALSVDVAPASDADEAVATSLTIEAPAPEARSAKFEATATAEKTESPGHASSPAGEVRDPASAPSASGLAKAPSAFSLETKKISRMKNTAEKALKTAQKSLRNAKSLTADARARADSEIKVSEDLFEAGKDFLDDENAEAYAVFEQSLHASEQVSIFIKAAPTIEKARERGRNKRSNPTATSGKKEARVEISATTSFAATATPSVSEPVKDDSPDEEDEYEPEKESGDDSSGFKFLNKLNISL